MGTSTGDDAAPSPDALQPGTGDPGVIARRTAIVFAAAADGQVGSDIYIMEGDGSGLQRLTSTPGSEMYPAWSPDHTHIAFVRDMQLFVIDAAGRNERMIAPATGRNRLENGVVYSTILGPAVWSPDGTRLAYLYPRDAHNIDNGSPGMPELVDESYATSIHFVGADGTGDRPIARDPDRTINSLGWAPDGTLSFSQADDCPDCAGGQWMAVTKTDGSGLRELQYGSSSSVYGPSKQLDWNADGGRWVFVRGGMNHYDDPAALYTSKAYGATETKIGSLTGWNPRWSPDGNAIAYIGENGIFVTDADGRRNDRLFSITPVYGIDW